MQDLEVVPHPENIFPVHVPSDTYGPGRGPPPQNIIHIDDDMNINTHIDIIMSFNIHIIICMNIEHNLDYYTLFDEYARRGPRGGGAPAEGPRGGARPPRG